MLQEPQPIIGPLVVVRGAEWRVVDVVRYDDCQAWGLEGTRPSNRGERRTLLVPFDRPRPVRQVRGPGRSVGRRRGTLALRALLAGTAGAGRLRTVAEANVEILDYQLEPALACLKGASRILLADEVGLGKTVQAALLLAELAARGEADRVLVLAPASLCDQWAEELSHRFHLEPQVVDGRTLRYLASWSSADEGPWARFPLAVASIDYVKAPDVLRGMGQARWDLLVVDEAHACAQARYRFAAVEWLARRARRVLLLTATPHGGDEEGFRALCAIGRFPGEPPMTMFRRTRAALGDPPTRRVRLLRSETGDAGARLHAALAAYAARVWRVRSSGGDAEPARLAMMVLCKRSASGAPALLSSLCRRLELLARLCTPPESVQLALPLDEDGTGEDEPPGDRVLGARGLDECDEEQRVLGELVELARAASAIDSKTRLLFRLLARVREPALVFTEYRDTLERLAPALAPLGEVVTLHGGLDRSARRAAIARFTSGCARVLLATDAGSHGLNLQAACRFVVNHELPWSPMRLEQRIGRVDRIGQRRTVHAVHLVARGTFEDEVLGRLALKLERVRTAVGLAGDPLGRMGERDVGEKIMEGGAPPAVAPGGKEVRTGSGAKSGRAEYVLADLRAEAREEARRLAGARALLAGPGAGRTKAPIALADCLRTGPWHFVVRADRAAFAPGIYAIYRLQVLDAHGTRLDEALVPLFLAESFDGAEHRSIEARWASASAAFDAAAAKEADRLVASLRETLAGAVSAQSWRESQIAAAEDREPDPVQPGLFDARALKAAGEAAVRRQAAAEAASARLRALDAAVRPVLAGPAELLIVFAAARGRRPRWR
jgi:superfamily II DNA or RNA helicase